MDQRGFDSDSIGAARRIVRRRALILEKISGWKSRKWRRGNLIAGGMARFDFFT